MLAVVAGYTANAILVAATEQLLTLHAPPGGAPPLVYFVVDLITQCLYTVAGGYLCRLIARSRRVAIGRSDYIGFHSHPNASPMDRGPNRSASG